jgi:predicted peptidase
MRTHTDKAAHHDRGTLRLASLTHDGRTLPYALWLPPGYDARQRWPLVLFLHGSGERGTDGVRMLAQGLPRTLPVNNARWPAVVLIPQLTDEGDVRWPDAFGALDALLDRTMRELSIDPDRVYLTGLSRGGHGTWAYGAHRPETFAALAPVCGYGEPEQIAPRVAALPVWAFHGDKDDIIPHDKTVAIVRAIEAAGGHPRMTIYPGVNHGSWEPAYADPELPRWMLAQRRAGTGK